jgi:plasmid rolling circle replication initiator protein Rep
MYNNDTINTRNNQEVEVLIDKDKSGKERPWCEKKLKTLTLADSYERLGMEKFYRVRECGTYLEYRRYLKTQDLKLHSANFCKVRLCPMCAWRRSKKIFSQVSKVMDHALEDNEYRFIFLTLTCKNIYGEELSSQIDTIFKAYHKLMRRKKIKLAIKGWFRALEVTHDIDEFITKDMYYGNKEKHIKSRKKYYDSRGLHIGDKNPNYDTYHPHFHIILMVNKSYFDDSKLYITQEKWTSLWKSCMNVDYIPVVNIKAFKTGSIKQVAKSVSETAKYTVKDNDYIVKDSGGNINEELTDSAVWILDTALANRRLTAFGGLLKTIHSKLRLDDIEKGSLIDDGIDEELREDLEYIIEQYHWHIGYNQYVKIGERIDDDKSR